MKEIRLEKRIAWAAWILLVISVGFLCTGIWSRLTACWVLSVITGLVAILSLLSNRKRSVSLLVINQKGIQVDNEYKYFWGQTHHCFIVPRFVSYGRFARRSFFLVVVSNDHKRHDICLEGYHIRPKKLANEINQLVGKKICYLDEADERKEKELEKSNFRAWCFIMMILLFGFLVWLIASKG